MIYGYVTKTFLTGGYKLSLYTQPINLKYSSNQAGKYDAYELFLSKFRLINLINLISKHQ